MRPRHVLVGLAIALVWGVNFVFIDLGLRHFPPLLFAALRFALVAVPAVFVVPRPAVAVRWLVLVGLFLGAGQFGLLFTAMRLGLPAGLSSLVLQAQVIFTLILAAAVLRERPSRLALVGVGVAAAGMGIIALGRGTATALVPLLLALGAAASWGVANVCTRLARPPAGLGLLVWSSLVPPLPLLALSAVLEGPHAIAASFTAFHPDSVLGLAYVVAISTFGGFGLWNMLLRQYPASVVAPFTLLVPVFGMAAAGLALGERPAPLEWVGAVVVVAGLALLAFRGGLVAARRRAPRRAVLEDAG
jgi:O-acetylserine/cysteine efflux transporter